MSQLHKGLKPVLLPMMLSAAQAQLDGDLCQRITAWFTNMFIVMDADPKRSDASGGVCTQEDRDILMTERRASANFEVFLGRYDGRKLVGSIALGAAGSYPVVRSFLFGRLFGVVSYRPDGVAPSASFPHSIFQFGIGGLFTSPPIIALDAMANRDTPNARRYHFRRVAAARIDHRRQLRCCHRSAWHSTVPSALWVASRVEERR